MTSALKKSGFVVLVGRSNVGKSTLLNTIVGTKVAIVTPKAQTTRHPVRGIYTDERGQMVFVDTPGFFLGKKDLVSVRLNELAKQQLDGIEAIVYVMDPTREPGQEEEHIQNLLRTLSIPKIAVINKCDLPLEKRPATQQFKAVDVGQRVTLELSALTHNDVNRLLNELFTLMPTGEAFYPDAQLTDIPQKEWLEELIREKVFLHVREEVPYSIHVEVTEVESLPSGGLLVEATIFTTEERYKGMIIGKGASMLKAIGSDARHELEQARDEHVRINLHVDVDPKWPQRFQ